MVENIARQPLDADLRDLALEGADYAIEKLFPLPTAEKKEDAKY